MYVPLLTPKFWVWILYEYFVSSTEFQLLFSRHFKWLFIKAYVLICSWVCELHRALAVACHQLCRWNVIWSGSISPFQECFLKLVPVAMMLSYNILHILDSSFSMIVGFQLYGDASSSVICSLVQNCTNRPLNCETPSDHSCTGMPQPMNHCVRHLVLVLVLSRVSDWTNGKPE